MHTEKKQAVLDSSEVIWGHCSANCHGRCPLRFHIVDGAPVKVDSELPVSELETLPKACLRGLSYLEFMNHPERLKYPMKRVGPRGSSEFQRISWQEATELICNEYLRIKSTYGPNTIYKHDGTGLKAKNIPGFLDRFLCINGGYLSEYGGYSEAQTSIATEYLFGDWINNSLSDASHSKLIVLFGDNPAGNMISGNGGAKVLAKALEESGAECVVIDPRFTETAAVMADEWIPIRPGTDAALAEAIAYVLITECMADEQFLHEYCVGFDSQNMPDGVSESEGYKAYILGSSADKTPKTPAWAARITQVPEAQIVDIARKIGSAKPCCIIQGLGLQRTSNGEQTSRAIHMLSVLTGNVGISGGGTGGYHDAYEFASIGVPSPQNGVPESIPTFLFADAVDHGIDMTAENAGIRGADKLRSNIKMIWNYAGNALTNQHGDASRASEILKDESKCEFIVTWDVFMTDSAKHSDVVLPDLLPSEQPSLATSCFSGNVAYAIMGPGLPGEKYERKTLFESLREFSAYLGNEAEFTEGLGEAGWLRVIYENLRNAEEEATGVKLPDFEEMMRKGIHFQKSPSGEKIAFEDFRKDPINNPLKTESGKIEIYSRKIEQLMNRWELPDQAALNPLPKYQEGKEGHGDALSDVYPLQLFGFHPKSRVHSTFAKVDGLDKVDRQLLWINPIDARSRGVSNGDQVLVFNDRGTIQIEAFVTKKIIPGTVAMQQGSWRNVQNGVDVGSCCNTLTQHAPSPLAKGAPMHANLVEVKLAKSPDERR